MRGNRKKKVIDVETLEVFSSVKECACALGVSPASVVQSIIMKTRVGGGRRHYTFAGRLLEYYDYWSEAWTAKEKEKHSRKNGFYFFEVGENE